MPLYQFEFEIVPADGNSWRSKDIGTDNIEDPSFMGRVIVSQELASGACMQFFGDGEGAPDAVTEDHIWGNESSNCIDLYFEENILENIFCKIDLRKKYDELIADIVSHFSRMNCAVYYEEKIYPLSEDKLNELIISSEAYKFCNSPDEFFGVSGDTYLDKIKMMIKTENPVSVKESDMNSENAKLLLSLGVPRDDLEFFSMYGMGNFEDYFRFISPFSEHWDETVDDLRNNYNYLKNGEQERMREYPEFAKIPPTFVYNFYPEDNGLLPWACTDDNTYYWKINGGKITAIVVDHDEFTEFENMSVTEFMYKMFCGQLDEQVTSGDIFSGGIFLKNPSYEEWGGYSDRNEKYDDDISSEERRKAIQMVSSLIPSKEEQLMNMLRDMESMGVPREMIEMFKKQNGIEDENS